MEEFKSNVNLNNFSFVFKGESPGAGERGALRGETQRRRESRDRRARVRRQAGAASENK